MLIAILYTNYMLLLELEVEKMSKIKSVIFGLNALLDGGIIKQLLEGWLACGAPTGWSRLDWRHDWVLPGNDHIHE